MTDFTDNKTHETIDGTSLELMPTPKFIDLKTFDDLRLEMARVYRSMRSQEIDAGDGNKYIWALAQIGKMVELQEVKLLKSGNTFAYHKLEPLKDEDFLG